MIKLSVNETKWSILLARTRALILIFRFEYLILGPLSYREFRETGPWRQLFERWMPLFTGWFSIHWIAQLVSPILIRWVAIYPVDSTIHLWTTGAWSIKDYLHGQKEKIFSRGRTREVPSEQDEFILPAGVASQNTFFASSCPLMNSAI